MDEISSDEKLKIITRFSKNLVSLSSSKDLIKYVVREVVGQLGFVDCVIYRLNQDEKMLEQIAAYGVKSSHEEGVVDALQIPLGKGITGTVAQTGEPLIIKDTSKDDRFIPDINEGNSEICVPIQKDDKLWGVIDCEHPEKGYFDEYHLDILSTIATLLAFRISDWENLKELNKSRQELIETQEHLEESEEKYRLLFELSEDPMMLLTENKFELCNEAAAVVFKYDSPQEMETAHPSEASPPKQPCGMTSFEKAELMMAKALDKGFNRFDWMHRKKTGEDFPMEVTLTKVPYKKSIALFAICRDITQRKEIEKELNLALQNAREANLSKSRFLANMSHELRTPLNAVIGFSQILENEMFGPIGHEKYLGYAGDIHKSGGYLLNLINDILELSTFDAEERKLEKKLIQIPKLISNTKTILGNILHERGQKLEVEIQQNLPPLIADKRSLQQILINLINNSIKFTPRNKSITVRVSEIKKGHLFEILDEGRGISKEDLKTITDRFDRGSQDPFTTIEGTGLGLAIVKNLVELHHGTLDINSKLNWGTTVSFIIPKEK